jgi:hypothetical protein
MAVVVERADIKPDPDVPAPYRPAAAKRIC